MFVLLPETVEAFEKLEWSQIEPFYNELAKRPFNQETVEKWLADWSKIRNLIAEKIARLRIATTQNTKDVALEKKLQSFLKNINVPAQKYNNQLMNRLLESGLTVAGMELPLKKIRAESELFNEENLTLFNEEVKLANQYNRIVGSQSVEWEGERRTLVQMRTLFDSPDRTHREEIWLKMAARPIEDRVALNELWQSLLKLRQRIARNAGFDNYLAYRWKLLKRFDYTPEDSLKFHKAIEEKVVPAASRVYRQLAKRLGVEKLRPWDVATDFQPLMYPKLNPMSSVDELVTKSSAMFYHVGPEFGDYFKTMQDESLLDLPNHASKAPGGYCTYFSVAKRPFIFMNAVGSADDIRTMLHEAGHAFHAFESNNLPYTDQRHPGHEFSEVASMAMELIASPYLTSDFGGFYDLPEEAAHHRVNHLRKIITFWPYMAVVDAFQHWVYKGGEEALDTDACDAKWAELWHRFLPNIDWHGFEDVLKTGWHRKQHIFRAPFYYVEYGMAQVGAIQVWRNVLNDRQSGIEMYRHALAQGGTKSLHELYALAGANFKFDSDSMHDVVAFLEEKIEEQLV